MFIDTHAHIYVEQFNVDFDAVINRAQIAQVSQILMPNIDLSSIKTVFERSTQYPKICKPMVGLHPCSVKEDWADILSAMEDYLSQEEVVAIGETGIDLYWDTSFENEQKTSFRHQIDWALKYDLPIVIHSRSAIDHTISIIKEKQNGFLRGVFHCFDGSAHQSHQIMDLGFFMGIGGVITYKKNASLRQTIAQIPLEHILLETDSPYLPPTPYRGKRNEPSYVTLVADKLAECKNINPEEVGEITTRNARQLFRV